MKKMHIRLIAAIATAVTFITAVSAGARADIFFDNGIIYDSDTGCCRDTYSGSYYDPSMSLYRDSTGTYYITETGRAKYIPSPYIDYTTLYDIEYAAGFVFRDANLLINGMTNIEYTLTDGIIQIRYRDEYGDDITLRKGAGSCDVSGDNSTYDTVLLEEIDGTDVTFRGFNGRYNLAVWTKGNYSYSIRSSASLTLNEMENLVFTLL